MLFTLCYTVLYYTILFKLQELRILAAAAAGMDLAPERQGWGLQTPKGKLQPVMSRHNKGPAFLSAGILTCVCICTYICTYVYICACTHIYMYIYMYLYYFFSGVEAGAAEQPVRGHRNRDRVVVQTPTESPSFLFRASAKFARRLSPDEARRLVLLLEPNRGSRRNADGQVSGRLRNVRTHLAMSRHLLRLFPNALEEDVPQLHELHSVSALVFGHGAGAFARAFLHVAPVASWLQSLRRVRELGQGASGTVTGSLLRNQFQFP